jgi:hypothetical protein
MITPQTPRGVADQLLARVGPALADAGYQVTPTPDGFDFQIDFQDQRWYGLFTETDLRETLVHRVRVDEASRRISIRDDRFTVMVSGGVFGIGAGLGMSSGRSRVKIYERTFGPDGRTWRFDSDDARSMVTDAAAQLGLTQVQGAAQRIGLVFGLVGAGIALIVLVVALAVFLATRV